MKRALLLALVASSALAGGNGVSSGGFNGLPPTSSSGFTPSSAPNVVQATTAALTFYVDPTGSDSNDCTATGASACLTIQGAINKIPKMLRHRVIVNVATGTFAPFTVSGFTADTGVQQVSGGITFQGTFANTTPATGTATGTATAGTAGSGSTFGTLTNGAQTWTVDNLIGKIIFITGGTGSGQARVISSNTATAITIVGIWTAPNGTSTYAIRDSASIISGVGVSIPATGLVAARAAAAQILIHGNNLVLNDGAITLAGLNIVNTGATGSVAAVLVLDQTSVGVLQSQFSTENPPVQLGGLLGGSSTFFTSGVFVGALAMDQSYAHGSLSFGVSSFGVGANISILRSFIHNYAYGVVTTAPANVSFQRSELRSVDDVGLAVVGSMGVLNSRIACTGATRAGISNHPDPSASTWAGDSMISTVANVNVDSTCGIGVMAVGNGAKISVTSLTGNPSVTALDARGGGSVLFSAATTITGGTQAVNIDLGGATAALADIVSGDCLAVAKTGSKVCRQ